MTWQLLGQNAGLVLALMTTLWVVSVVKRNASIVDPWWSMIFLLITGHTAWATGLTPATVNKSLAHLERLGVVTELTSKQRGRVFSYARVIAILNEGMDLPESGR